MEEVEVWTSEEVQTLVTKEEITRFLRKEYGSTEDILSLNAKHIKAIKHPVGGKVTSLATLSGWENPKKLNVANPIGFQAWVRWMYDLEEVKV